MGNISEVKAEDNSPAPVNDSKELQAVEQTLNGMEVDLEKKNLVNGKSQNETVSGAGGLGQGSPKVSFCDRNLVRLNFSSLFLLTYTIISNRLAWFLNIRYG